MATAAAAAHRAAVSVVQGRYPYLPTCSCGWTWRGYVAAHAAQTMVDAHLAGEV
jgi:hypothetical protein